MWFYMPLLLQNLYNHLPLLKKYPESISYSLISSFTFFHFFLIRNSHRSVSETDYNRASEIPRVYSLMQALLGCENVRIRGYLSILTASWDFSPHIN